MLKQHPERRRFPNTATQISPQDVRLDGHSAVLFTDDSDFVRVWAVPV